MDPTLPHLSIAMVRPTLDDLPRAPLPAPFSFRRYQPGDVAAWVRIHALADKFNVASPALFAERFGSDESELRERQLYLCDGAGDAIGTITAWHNDHYPGLCRGRVHWVAIVPAYQGRGLGKPLLAACLRRMVDLGYESAYLTTNPPRVPAINLYLGFGFAPDVRSAEERDAWRLLEDRVRGKFRDAIREATCCA